MSETIEELMARAHDTTTDVMREFYLKKLREANVTVDTLKWLATTSPDDVKNYATAIGLPPTVLGQLLQGIEGVPAGDMESSMGTQSLNFATINTQGGTLHVHGNVQHTVVPGRSATSTEMPQVLAKGLESLHAVKDGTLHKVLKVSSIPYTEGDPGDEIRLLTLEDGTEMMIKPYEAALEYGKHYKYWNEPRTEDERSLGKVIYGGCAKYMKEHGSTLLIKANLGQTEAAKLIKIFQGDIPNANGISQSLLSNFLNGVDGKEGGCYEYALALCWMGHLLEKLVDDGESPNDVYSDAFLKRYFNYDQEIIHIASQARYRAQPSAPYGLKDKSFSLALNERMKSKAETVVQKAFKNGQEPPKTLTLTEADRMKTLGHVHVAARHRVQTGTANKQERRIANRGNSFQKSPGAHKYLANMGGKIPAKRKREFMAAARETVNNNNNTTTTTKNANA